MEEPDEIEVLTVDRTTLPPGQYREIGFERRQVFDIDIRRLITEYRAEILEDGNGQRFVAPFPDHIARAVQYGNGVKPQAVYLSQYQLIPYQRVQEYLDQMGLPISVGSIYNFNQQAIALLDQFERKLIDRLLASPLLHADETGININGRVLQQYHPAPALDPAWRELTPYPPAEPQELAGIAVSTSRR